MFLRRFLLIIAGLLIFVSFANAQSSSMLDISVSLDKATYTYAEPIKVVLEAENSTGGNVDLSFTTGCQLSFRIYRYMDDTQNYSMPVYNEFLAPRNCDETPTSLTIPDERKAIWTRTFEGTLLPGSYMIHAYITDQETEIWSYDPDSYATFTVEDPDDLAPIFSEEEWDGQLCKGTGGDSDAIEGCVCEDGFKWSDSAGCALSVDLIELCIETGGLLAEDDTIFCYCNDKRWDTETGCSEGLPIGPGVIPIFNDIEGHWGKEYINELAEEGVITGYSDGGFHPNDNINRAELVKMALSAAEISSEIPQDDDEFGFVDLDTWQIPWVYAAWNRDIVQGYDESSFEPAKNITRAEALKIALLSFDVEVPNTNDEWAFEDTIDHWALSYINKAYLDFIVSGREDGLFYPNDPITRAEAAKIINLLSD
jgi:hypothetical protein